MEVERTFQGTKDFPKQDEFIAAFFAQKHKYYILTGGNRAGKTYAARACVGWYLREKAQDGDIFWMVGPNMDKSVSRQQRDLWEALPRECFGSRRYNPATGFGGVNPTVLLHMPDGRELVVRFMSEAQWRNDPKAFEAESIAGVWIDETVSEDAFDTMIWRTIDRKGWVLGSFIPNVSWVHQRFAEPEPGQRVVYVELWTTDNPYLPQEEVAEMGKSVSEEVRQVRLFGKPAYLSSLVYACFEKDYAPKGHLCKPFPVPGWWPRWRALDWGTRSPTTCLWLTASPRNTVYVYREYYAAGRSAQEHVKAITAMSGPEAYQGPAIIDPSVFVVNQANMTSVADEFQRHGFSLVPAVRATSQRSFEAQVETVKDWFMGRHPDGRPMLQVFDGCKWTIRELRKWSYRMDKFGNPDPDDRYEKGNDHCLDAMRYCIVTAHPTFRREKVQVFDRNQGADVEDLALPA